MAQYDFYAAILRYVASTADRADPRVSAMMECLEQAADHIDSDGSIRVEASQRELFSRALAGVAAFLQQRILPETIADQNKQGEAQVRWSVDTSLDAVTRILQAQAAENPNTVIVDFPPPPALAAP